MPVALRASFPGASRPSGSPDGYEKLSRTGWVEADDGARPEVEHMDVALAPALRDGCGSGCDALVFKNGDHGDAVEVDDAHGPMELEEEMSRANAPA